jgi:hypothetical protein
MTEEPNDLGASPFPGVSQSDAMFNVLRQSADSDVANLIEGLVREAPDHKLSRINVLDFASSTGLDEERSIAAFLHAARIGIFDFSWSVLCPGCGSLLDAATTLKNIRREKYECSLCVAANEITLDEMVEVSFTVAPRVRRIPAHEPDTLPIWEYYRQIVWSSAIDLPDNFKQLMEEAILDSVELSPGDTARLSLSLPESRIVVFEPKTHSAQHLDVNREPTRERRNISIVYTNERMLMETVRVNPGPVLFSLENRSNVRVLPVIWVLGSAVSRLLHGKRKRFLTAKRLLSNQTFRDLYRTETLDVRQRLKITSMVAQSSRQSATQ